MGIIKEAYISETVTRHDVLPLSFLKKSLQGKKRTELAQLDMEKEIRLAEEKFGAEKEKAALEAEKERAAAQARREETLARDCVSLSEKILQVQQALSMEQMGNERNADDQKAQVEIHRSDAEFAQADAARARAEAAQAKAEAERDRAHPDLQALNQEMLKIFQTFGASRGETENDGQAAAPAAGQTEPAASAQLLKDMTDIINGILERVMPAVNRPPEPAPTNFINMKQCSYCGELNTARAVQCWHCHMPFINQ